MDSQDTNTGVVSNTWTLCGWRNNFVAWLRL